MYKKQRVWKLLEVEEGYAKPINNDWDIAKIFHCPPLPTIVAKGKAWGTRRPRCLAGSEEKQDGQQGDEGKE